MSNTVISTEVENLRAVRELCVMSNLCF